MSSWFRYDDGYGKNLYKLGARSVRCATYPRSFFSPHLASFRFAHLYFPEENPWDTVVIVAEAAHSQLSTSIKDAPPVVVMACVFHSSNFEI